jgi:toxin ParE1/3/4
MAKFRFSRLAEADLLSIGEYTLHEWGKAQAARYIGELEVCCQALAGNPALGRLCDEVRPGLRRHEHGKHVIFYRQERRGILVSRVLHQRMLPERHALDNTDDGASRRPSGACI